MISKTPGNLSAIEFDQLVDAFLEQEDPHAVSLEVLAELATEREADPIAFEFLGRVVNGRVEVLPLVQTESYEIENNEIHLSDGRRIAIQVRTLEGAKT